MDQQSVYNIAMFSGVRLILLLTFSILVVACGSNQLKSEALEGPSITVNQDPKLLSFEGSKRVVDKDGYSLYFLDESITCSDSCEFVWPPYTLDVVPAEFDKALFSIKKDSENRNRLLLTGKKLHLYSGDNKAGEINGLESGETGFLAKID